MDKPLILTLKLDDGAFAMLDGLRRAHFPPARNLVPAHLTLFHALPGDEEPAIRQTLAELCAETPPPPLRLPEPRFMGRGVLLTVEGPELIGLRGRLAERWAPWLSAQDRQGYRPHVTVQNKAAPEAARELLAELRARWEPLEARGEALLLWRYLGGPWERLGEFGFRSG